MIVKIISGQFLKFFRGLLVQCIDFIHRGFRVRVSLDVNEGQLLNELLLHGITSFLPPQFYHGRGRGTRGAERRKGVRGMEVSAQKELQSKIIRLLEEKNCTVREAKYILSQVNKYIDAYSTVQFAGMPNYEL